MAYQQAGFAACEQVGNQPCILRLLNSRMKRALLWGSNLHTSPPLKNMLCFFREYSSGRHRLIWVDRGDRVSGVNSFMEDIFSLSRFHLHFLLSPRLLPAHTVSKDRGSPSLSWAMYVLLFLKSRCTFLPWSFLHSVL